MQQDSSAQSYSEAPDQPNDTKGKQPQRRVRARESVQQNVADKAPGSEQMKAWEERYQCISHAL